MFAYCLNNAIALDDATGRYPSVSVSIATLDYRGGSGENAEKVIEKNDSQNKIFAVAKSLYNNVELSGGFGQGLYGGFNVLDIVDINIGAYANYGSAHLYDGEFYSGQEIFGELSLSVLSLFEVGFGRYSYRENFETKYTDNWNWYSAEQDSLTLFSGGTYLLFAGVSWRVGFDIVTFFEDMWEIF